MQVRRRRQVVPVRGSERGGCGERHCSKIGMGSAHQDHQRRTFASKRHANPRRLSHAGRLSNPRRLSTKPTTIVAPLPAKRAASISLGGGPPDPSWCSPFHLAGMTYPNGSCVPQRLPHFLEQQGRMVIPRKIIEARYRQHVQQLNSSCTTNTPRNSIVVFVWSDPSTMWTMPGASSRRALYDRSREVRAQHTPRREELITSISPQQQLRA